MSFDTGSISFRRFKVIGASINSQDVINAAMAHLLLPNELRIVEEVEYGWSGGEHVLDTELTFGKNVFVECVHFALRIDTNKPPAALVKAYTKQEEAALAAGNPSGFISKIQKREAKETVRRKIDEERKTGKFKKTRLVAVLYDTERSTVYANATGTVLEYLSELFQRTFADRTLAAITSGVLAERWMTGMGRGRDFEDLRPSQFIASPDGADAQPDYPWVAKVVDSKSFLGNEFLLWLWHSTTTKSGIDTTQGLIEFLFDRSLDMECAYGQTGKDSIRGDGPVRSTEAFSALAAGKVPRKAYLMMVCKKDQFSFTFNPELMAFNAAVLPEVQTAENPRVLFEERTALLARMIEIVDATYTAFLDQRASSAWSDRVFAIARWIDRTSRNAKESPAAVAS